MRKMATSAVALLTATGVLETAMPGKVSVLHARRIAWCTFLRAGRDVDVIVTCAIVGDVLEWGGQYGE
jgi:hypothetical protein